MISRQVIDLINSCRAVSITGSGISADAGIPTWNRHLELVDRYILPRMRTAVTPPQPVP